MPPTTLTLRKYQHLPAENANALLLHAVSAMYMPHITTFIIRGQVVAAVIWGQKMKYASVPCDSDEEAFDDLLTRLRETVRRKFGAGYENTSW